MRHGDAEMGRRGIEERSAESCVLFSVSPRLPVSAS